MSLKLRLGWASEKPTFLKIARAAQEAGVDAIALHPRSRAQRYRQPADWSAVRQLVEQLSIPVIGNGDVLTWRDAVARADESGCAAVMDGRWALTKPGMFREFAARRDIVRPARRARRRGQLRRAQALGAPPGQRARGLAVPRRSRCERSSLSLARGRRSARAAPRSAPERPEGSEAGGVRIEGQERSG